MTEERIGGISVGIGGSIADLEAALAAAQKSLDNFAEKNPGINIPIGATVGKGGAQSSRASTAGSGSSSSASAGKSSDITPFTRAVGDATTRLTAFVAALTSANSAMRRTSASPSGGGGPAPRAIAAQQQQARQQAQSPANVAADTAAALTSIASSPQRAVRAASAVQRQMPKTAAQASSMAAALTTEFDPHATYRFDPGPNDEVRPGAAAYSAKARQDTIRAVEQLGDRVIKGINKNPAHPSIAITSRAMSNPAQRTITGQTGGGDAEGALTPPPGMTGEEQRAQEAENRRRLGIEGPSTYETPREKAAKDKAQARERARIEKANKAEADRREKELNTMGAAQPRGLSMQGSRAMMGEIASNTTRAVQTDARIGRAQYNRRIQEANIERQREVQIATQEASINAAGRTPNTLASTLSAFRFGPRRRQIEAQAEVSAATQNRRGAQRLTGAYEFEIASRQYRLDNDANMTLSKRSKLEKEIQSIVKDPGYVKAKESETAALKREADATRNLQKISEGAGTALQSLAAVTLGGAAFGLGMKAVGAVTDLLVSGLSPAISRAVDANTNFSASNTAVTASLAQQTAALQGNAKGAIVSAAATANVSAAQADYLTTALTPETMVKAGTTALKQSADLFKAAAGAKSGAGVQGLVGGYGGIGGGAAFGTQMGGAQGFLETLAQNMQDFQSAADKAKPTVSYNPLKQGPLGLLPWGSAARGLDISNPAFQDVIPPSASDQASSAAAVQARAAYISNLSTATARGGTLTGSPTGLSLQPLKPGESAQGFVEGSKSISAEAGTYAAEIASSGYVLKDAFGNIASSGTDLSQAFMDMAAGLSTPDLSTVTKQAQIMSVYNENIREAADIGGRQAALQQVQFQQAKTRPAFTGQLTRTAELQTGQINPTQAYLENLANPPIAPGAGISLSRKDAASTQARVNAGIKEAQGLQSQLDAYYEQGRQQIEQTYKPAIFATFGQAGVQVFDGLLSKAQSVSAKIQSIETGVTKEQAQYATHQYENDLRIAKRSLTDILQLTGQIGSASGDNLGYYERQNLVLGRQAQQLQFMLSQKQINFQTAIAGFQVPGLTPAEQNARVQEAKTEASYAQKQLDIQKAMFGNQVKVVDISNLRQATDLMHQIGLLQEGRKVTLDTTSAQARLTRLQKIQSAIQKDLSSYTGAVDSLSAKAISDIAEQEQAVGHAISTIEAQSVKAAYNVGHALFLGISGGFLGTSVGTSGKGSWAMGGASGTSKNDKGHAAGFLGVTTGSTHMIVGEAGSETVAVLRNPRSAQGGFGMGGGGDIVINLTAMLDGAVIYRDVVRRQGRDAALRGLRGVN